MHAAVRCRCACAVHDVVGGIVGAADRGTLARYVVRLQWVCTCIIGAPSACASMSGCQVVTTLPGAVACSFVRWPLLNELANACMQLAGIYWACLYQRMHCIIVQVDCSQL